MRQLPGSVNIPLGISCQYRGCFSLLDMKLIQNILLNASVPINGSVLTWAVVLYGLNEWFYAISGSVYLRYFPLPTKVTLKIRSWEK